MRDDITVVVYTNEKGFDITYLTLPHVIKAFSNVLQNIWVISNRVPSLSDTCNVTYFNADIEFCSNGGHFRETLSKALEAIPTEYILFLCDDYLFRSPVNEQRFNSIMQLILENKIDYFSFSSLCYCDAIIKNWRTSNINLSQYKLDGVLYEIDENYRHLYSIQPCIWSKSSFKKLLTHNTKLTGWDLDNTNICNTRGIYRELNHETNYYIINNDSKLDYNFKNLTLNHPPLTYNIDNRAPDSDFYVLDYGEIIRHGKFIDSETNSKKLAFKYLENCNEVIKNKLKRFL